MVYVCISTVKTMLHKINIHLDSRNGTLDFISAVEINRRSRKSVDVINGRSPLKKVHLEIRIRFAFPCNLLWGISKSKHFENSCKNQFTICWISP